VFHLDTGDLDLDLTLIDGDAYAAWRDRAHVSIAAEMTGTARRIFDMALAYAKERKTFGKPISEHQLVAAMIAEMAIRWNATLPATASGCAS